MRRDQILADQVTLELLVQLRQRQHGGTARPPRCIAGEPRQEHLRQRSEEPLELAPATRLPGGGEDQPNLEVDRHLLEVPRGEIAAVVRVENLGDASRHASPAETCARSPGGVPRRFESPRGHRRRAYTRRPRGCNRRGRWSATAYGACPHHLSRKCRARCDPLARWRWALQPPCGGPGRSGRCTISCPRARA